MGNKWEIRGMTIAFLAAIVGMVAIAGVVCDTFIANGRPKTTP
jgi:hypothetical protein